MPQNALESKVIEPAGKPKASVLWLHGLGASADDFVGAINELNIADEFGVRFVFPNAPLIPVTINAGFRMPAWFDVHGLSDEDPVDFDGLKASSYLITEMIEDEVSSGVSSDHILLGGFSQGGALALYCGLRYAKELAGIFALSAFLPGGEMLDIEGSEANQGLPVFMAHGELDAVVDYAYGRRSYEHLQEQGYAVQWQDYAIEHEICPEELRALGKWIQQVLSH
jgi:phospholipase/carboxylesterase